MIVKTYYEGGRIDAFDTDHMTESLPLKGNLLTNYSIDLGDAKDGCIWLSSYYYESSERYRETVNPKGLPVARRRDGWSFLVADPDDVEKLLRMTVDGETVLVRVAGELVDATALRWAYDVAEDVAPMAVAAHGHLVGLLGNQDGVDVESEACRLMGFSREAFDAVSKAEPQEPDAEPMERDLF